MDKKQIIEAMVNKFLGWNLPEDFNPDGGISFKKEFNVEFNARHGSPPQFFNPIGTNLFSAIQAKAMFEYVMQDISIPPSNNKDYAEFIEAVKEVVRISDRKHDAWDKVKKYLNVPPPAPNFCEYCNGSGEANYVAGAGPDAYEVLTICHKCKGSGKFVTNPPTEVVSQTMSEQQNALLVVAEECGEVALELLELQKQLIKAMRFGIDEQRDLPTSNRERITAEWNDLLGAICHLQRHGIDLKVDIDAISRKCGKIEKYEQYSKDLGIIK